jgi:hypothetical protein
MTKKLNNRGNLRNVSNTKIMEGEKPMKTKAGILILACFVVLFIVYIIGISEPTSSPIIEQPHIEDDKNNIEDDENIVNSKQDHSFLQFKDADEIVINDQNGNLVVVNDNETIADLAQYFIELYLDTESERIYAYSITFSVNNNKYDIKINQTSINVNGTNYTFKNTQNGSELLRTVENLIVDFYWDSIVEVDRIYVNADDIVRTIAVNDSDIPKIVNIIKDSHKVEVNRSIYSVFPNYSLELSYGDSYQLEVILLHRQLIGIYIGEQLFIYQISPELWEIIDRQVPKTTYKSNDLYYLFQSSNLTAIVNDIKWDVFDEDKSNMQDVRDQIVRELLISLPDEQQVQSELFELDFRIKDSNVKVLIGEQGFEYEGQYYRSNNIKSRVINILNKL